MVDLSNLSDVVSESGLIATLVNHPEFVFFGDQVEAEHFSNELNAKYFRAISFLAKQDIPQIDTYNVSTAMAKLGVDNPPSPPEIAEFLENCQFVSRQTIEEYKLLYNNVLDKAFRRELLRKLRLCENMCANSKDDDIQGKVYNVLDNVMMEYSTTDDVPEFKNVVDDMWEKIVERQHSERIGYEFKFPTLNEYVTIERGELVLFGAQEKVGKSIMLLNCAVDLLRKGASVLYIDSELSTEQFTIRLISHLTGIEYKRIKYGRYSPEEEQLIKKSISVIKGWKFIHKNLPVFDAKTIYSVTRKAKHLQDIDVLIVDYFKMNKEDADAFETYMAGGALIDMTKNRLASELNIAALGAVQLTAGGKVADSAKIARNTSSLLVLRDKTPEEIDNDGGVRYGNKALVVHRNRNGEQMMNGEYISLMFDGNRITFKEPPNQPTHEQPV